MAEAFTLPQLSAALGAPYRTLHSWVEKGLLNPSVHRTQGTGRTNLFDSHDAFVVCVLRDLSQAGIRFDALQQTAARLAEERETLDHPAFLVVNGQVEITRDVEHVARTLKNGRLTIAYSTRCALDEVESIQIPTSG